MNEIESGEETYTRVETPISLLPDLTEYGIQEVERGVCEDTGMNRRILRANNLQWTQLLDNLGKPSGNIQAMSREMLAAKTESALEHRKALLKDPRDKDSDYITGIHLVLEDRTDDFVPAWVMSATRHWMEVERVRDEQDPDEKPYRPALAGPPGRCTFKRQDSIRCLNWHGGRKTEHGYCRLHVHSTNSRDSHLAVVEQARMRVRLASITAVDVLEELMESAESEPVRLKATTEILDRAGVRGGIEIDQNVNVEVKPAREIVLERLGKLAAANAPKNTEKEEIVDAEIVEDER